MVKVKFNKDYNDKELNRLVKADEAVEMTVKRADEAVKNVRAQSDQFKGYEVFDYERVEEPNSKKENKEEAKEDDKKDKKEEKE